MASSNIEIKARCADLPAARLKAKSVATQWLGVDRQVDTYFQTKAGRLKLRESSLSGAQLVPYLRPDQAGPRRSDYQVIPIEDAEVTKRLLVELLGQHAVVAKEREIALVDNVRIHLDRVEGLGEFVELEAVFDRATGDEAAEMEKVRHLMTVLGVGTDELVEVSYEALIRARRLA